MGTDFYGDGDPSIPMILIWADSGTKIGVQAVWKVTSGPSVRKWGSTTPTGEKGGHPSFNTCLFLAKSCSGDIAYPVLPAPQGACVQHTPVAARDTGRPQRAEEP